MTNKTTFHKASHSDIPTLIENRILFAFELGGQKSAVETENLRIHLNDYLSRSMATNSCISFLAKQADKVVGVGTLQLREQPGNFKNPSGKWGYIMNMYTHPSFRGQGICSSILQKLMEEGQALGISAFELHATETGEKVYLKNGFEKHVEPTLRRYEL